jgi:tetratricopeptide (TPR) repeat protein
MNQNYDWIQYGVGMVYMMKARYKAAENKFNELLATNSSFGNAYAQLGLIRKIEERKDEAEALFEKAIACDLGNEIANYQNGLIKLQMGNYDDAATHLERVIKGNPSRIDALIDIGLVHGRKGNFDTAKKLIDEAYCKDRNQKDGYARLGWILAETSDWAGALGFLEKDHEMDRLSPLWQLHLAQLYGRIGDFKKAAYLIEQTYTRSESVNDGYAILGCIKAEAWDWVGAIWMMEKDRKAGRLSPSWQLYLAQLYGRIDDFTRAEYLVEQAYTQSASVKDGYAMLAWIKAEAQDFASALTLISRDHEKGRLSSGWQTNLAVIRVFMGDYDGAVNLIEDLYAEDESSLDGYLKLGWAHYLSSGNEDSLHLHIEKDCRLDRLSIEGRRIHAIALSMREKLAPASMLMDAIYAENVNLKDGFAMMGWQRVKVGDLRQGMTFMEKDYRLQRLSPVWRINYAYQLAKMRQAKKAQSLFNEVMKIEPNRQVFRIGYQVWPEETLTKLQFQELICFKA